MRATLLYCFILLKSQSWVVHLGGVESMSSSCSWQTGLLILLFAHVECLCFQVLVFKFIMSLKVGTTNQWIEVFILSLRRIVGSSFLFVNELDENYMKIYLWLHLALQISLQLKIYENDKFEMHGSHLNMLKLVKLVTGLSGGRSWSMFNAAACLVDIETCHMYHE